MATKRIKAPDRTAARSRERAGSVGNRIEKDRDEPTPGDREKLTEDELEKFEDDAMRERDA